MTAPTHPGVSYCPHIHCARTSLLLALISGVRLNADNFAELDRIDAILKKIPSKSIIGQLADVPGGVDRFVA